MSQHPKSRPARAVSRAEGFGLGLIATGAASVAIGAVVAVVIASVEIFARPVTVRMPVHSEDAVALTDFESISAAQYATADVTLDSIPAGARWLLLTEAILPALATIGVCVVAYWLSLALMRSRPFQNAVANAIGVSACLVIFGGLGGQLAAAIARAMIVDDLAQADPAAYDVLWTFQAELDLAPVGWAFALALIAGAFSIAARLQRDTEGLV